VKEQKYFSALEVHIQCLFVLLIEVRSKEGITLGSEKGKVLESGLCCKQKK
jgi:hypothetical protein